MLKFLKRGKSEQGGKVVALEAERQEANILPPAAAAASSSTVVVISKPADDVSPGPATPVLDDEDAKFLERLTAGTSTVEDADVDEARPPLPPRVKTPELSWDEDSESFRRLDAKETGKQTTLKDKPARTKSKRLSFFQRKDKTAKVSESDGGSRLTVPVDSEVDREQDDITRVLDDLNLSARNNKVFSLSEESTELVRKFTLILKDLVNGVPTAANDLTSLLNDSDGTLSKNFEKLPKSFRKIVEQVPNKLSTTLAPELLLVAAEAQGISKEEAAKGGLKGAAKSLLMPKSLSDLVTKPGAVAGMLKAIVNALKLRWPAFIGTNMLWSVALFLLLFVLWYCHKRGREVRLAAEELAEQEAAAKAEGAA